MLRLALNFTRLGCWLFCCASVYCVSLIGCIGALVESVFIVVRINFRTYLLITSLPTRGRLRVLLRL